MNALLRALLLRNRLCMAPAGEGSTGGGAVADADESLDEPDDSEDDAGADTAGDGTGDDAGDGGAAAEEEDDGELVIGFGDEPGPEVDEEAIAEALAGDEPKNAAFARMRTQNKDLKRQTRDQAMRLQQLEAKVAEMQPPAPEVVVGAEPTLESCDYDTDKFATDFKAWHTRKAAVEAQQRERQQAAEREQQQFADRLAKVDAALPKAKVPDFEDAVGNFDATLTPLQRGLVLGLPDDPAVSAKLRVALGRDPVRLKKLAGLEPAKFIREITRLEDRLTSTPRKAPPPAPERRLTAGKPGAAVDSQLARLEAIADKTGDRSQVLAYKREQKAKQAA